MTGQPRFAIIGGGIAGLAAAYELSNAPGESADIFLFESSGRLGGNIETEARGDLLLELGPDAFLTTKPWAVELCGELGIGDQLIGTNPEKRDVYILHNNRLEKLPEGLIMMVPTSFSALATTPLLSPAGKFRAGLELLLPAGREHGPESIEGFVVRRFGRELYNHIVEPMMSGIYAGDGRRLSIEATFPLLSNWERELGSVARGALRLRNTRLASSFNGKTRKSLFSTPRDGMQALVNSLESLLLDRGVRISVSSPIRSVIKTKTGYTLTYQDNELLVVDGLVLATPAYVTAELLSGLDPSLAAMLKRIEYASTVTVNLAFEDDRVAQMLTGYGYVIPACEGRLPLACTWTSTKFDHRAPAGTALLRVFLGRAGQGWVLEQSDDFLLEQARQEVAWTLGITSEPDLVRVKRWPRAMPQYNVGHLDLIDQIESATAAHPGVQLAGAAYHGIGIPDCIHSGREAARKMAERHTVVPPSILE
jgi:oxygen-dependent protoporphyrinogen oxidase